MTELSRQHAELASVMSFVGDEVREEVYHVQREAWIELADLAGRPALVTFAFGHCETVCPLTVSELREVQEQADGVPRLVVITLDPWRDTPSRLSHVVHHWKLNEDSHFMSGDVEQVQQVLDAWGIARQRNLDTGEVTHPPLVYILDSNGRITYAATGGVEAILELLSRS